MSDRLCIHSPNNEVKVEVSPEDVVSCCGLSCGMGCFGGYLGASWRFWHSRGIVTGGEYGSHEGCYPYEIEPCEHHVDGSRPPCEQHRTPRCHRDCEEGYPNTYREDKTFGHQPHTLHFNCRHIMKELMTDGPVEASFFVYEDFMNYKSGVYKHVHGSYMGGHAVRILGWGEENETKYWLVANSWNYDWGNNGTFKILRGRDHCMIESSCVAALPDFDHTTS